MVNQVRRYQNVGSFTARKFYNRQLALDGSVEAIAGFVLPPYVVPTQYWLGMRIGSVEGTTAFPPHYFADYRITGRIVPLPSDIDMDASGNDTLQEMMNQFAPHGDNSQPYNEQTGVQSAYGKVGTAEEDKMPWGAFFDREKRLGLPDTALFQSSDSIFLFDHFNTRGGFAKTLKEPEEASLLVFQAWIDEPAAGTAELNNLIGSGTAGRTPNDLAVEILDYFQQTNLTTLVSDTGDVDQDLMNWLSIGTLFDALPTLSGDEAINFATHLTVVGDVLVPHGANRVAAP